MIGDLDLAEKMVKELFSLNAKEIRDKMHALGITGRTGESMDCVVAQYVRQRTGVETAVCPSEVSLYGDVGECREMHPYDEEGHQSGEFSQFVIKFDSEQYPELVTENDG